MKINLSLTQKILMGMLLGAVFGTIAHYFKNYDAIESYIINGFFTVGGTLFISLMKMLIIPVVFISLVTGTCSMRSGKQLGRISLKTLILYFFTTSIAITIGLTLASLTAISTVTSAGKVTVDIHKHTPSLLNVLLNIVPTNPFEAFAKGEMLPIILFSLLFGFAVATAGKAGEKIRDFFGYLNTVVMQMIHMVIKLTPYGVFCLIGHLFGNVGLDAIEGLIGYFLVVIAALILHVIFTNSLLLSLIAKLNPLKFFKKMYPAMLFAFSISSSNVSIPIVLETVEEKLGVKNSIAAFVIPLGATINMDGTAIMQGVATVFIANSYHIHLNMVDYLMVVVTATLASIGTAGVPSVGLFMLAMVLQQVGIPAEGIGYIIGIDRILDMIRTAVNITGDATVACVVGRSEKAIDDEIFDLP